mmetsp:Transcript_5734/g.17649  ORF Transcript_5734/g.17649 Transcript_5734/m.17649 type:complete len:214 (+) Transcript_5734:1129-1770(+)
MCESPQAAHHPPASLTPSTQIDETIRESLLSQKACDELAAMPAIILAPRYGRTLQVARVVLIIAPIFAVFEVTVYLYLTDLYVYPVLIVCNHIIFVWFMCAAILDAVVEPALWLSQDVRRAAQHAISAIVVLASIWITMAVGFVVFFDLVSGYFGRQNGWVGGRAAANMASGTFLGLPMTGLREAAYSFMPQDPLNIRWFPGAMPFSAPSPPA